MCALSGGTDAVLDPGLTGHILHQSVGIPPFEGLFNRSLFYMPPSRAGTFAAEPLVFQFSNIAMYMHSSGLIHMAEES